MWLYLVYEQWMDTGESGVNGRPVLSRVVVECGLDLESVSPLCTGGLTVPVQMRT